VVAFGTARRNVGGSPLRGCDCQPANGATLLAFGGHVPNFETSSKASNTLGEISCNNVKKQQINPRVIQTYTRIVDRYIAHIGLQRHSINQSLFVSGKARRRKRTAIKQKINK